MIGIVILHAIKNLVSAIGYVFTIGFLLIGIVNIVDYSFYQKEKLGATMYCIADTEHGLIALGRSIVLKPYYVQLQIDIKTKPWYIIFNKELPQECL